MSLFATTFASLLAQRSDARRQAAAQAPAGTRDSALAARNREAALAELPPPVQRYLRLALPAGGVPIQQARLREVGKLRTSLGAERWLHFNAEHLIEPGHGDFDWNARAVGASRLPVRLRDSLVNGRASSQVSLLSTLRLRWRDNPAETTAAVLARYLAEAVWYPSALLPGDDLVWSPIDEHCARATLTRAGTSATLEFSFNAAGEIEGAYAPMRWGLFGRGYEQKPWQCFYSQPITVQGLRIPRRAESGWYEGGEWQRVTKTVVAEADYVFAREWTHSAALHDRIAFHLDADHALPEVAHAPAHGLASLRGPHHALAPRRAAAAPTRSVHRSGARSRFGPVEGSV